jgi:nucleoside-diphosphate-sugar epimerase
VLKFVGAVRDGRILAVHGGGDQRRYFSYIDDFINGLITASERPHGENATYNLGGTQKPDIRRLTEVPSDIGGPGNESRTFVYTVEIHGLDYDELVLRTLDIYRARDRAKWERLNPLKNWLRCTNESMTTRN